MAKTWLLLGSLLLAAACGGGALCSNGNECIALGACYTATNATPTCGVGLVCCAPAPVGDGG